MRTCLLLLTTPFILAACEADADPSTEGPATVTETIGDTTVVRTLSGSVWGAEATLVPEVSIGELDGPEEYLFGWVFSIAVRDYVRMHGRNRIALGDVAEVYRTELLGPSGQIDLAHYEARLRDGLGDAHRYRLAMEILAEAAVQGTFTTEARRQLEKRHSRLVEDAPRLVTETLDVLVHDDYLEPHPDGHRFMMNLLRDWWRARFRHHHRPLAEDRAIGFRQGDTP